MGSMISSPRLSFRLQRISFLCCHRLHYWGHFSHLHLLILDWLNHSKLIHEFISLLWDLVTKRLVRIIDIIFFSLRRNIKVILCFYHSILGIIILTDISYLLMIILLNLNHVKQLVRMFIYFSDKVLMWYTFFIFAF